MAATSARITSCDILSRGMSSRFTPTMEASPTRLRARVAAAVARAVAVCTGKRELSGMARGLDYLAHLGAQPPYAVSRFADAECSSSSGPGFASSASTSRSATFSMPPSIFPGSLNSQRAVPAQRGERNLAPPCCDRLQSGQERCTAWSSARCSATSEPRSASSTM